MRYLILSDIHANWEALEAVMAEAESEGFDDILCLGDVVGYGADPDICCEWVRNNSSQVVRGNHDRAAVGQLDLEWFNPAAQDSTLWTQKRLAANNASWLGNLPAGPIAFEGFQIVHGSPGGEDDYIIYAHEALALVGSLAERVTFFGHTHIQGGFQLIRNNARILKTSMSLLGRVECDLEPDSYYLVNPGAVGQPRDHDPRAAWAIYHSGERRVVYYRTPYDVQTAQAKIIAAGLPDSLALRLAIGK
ncbi:MAG: metallophosphoesterase family protein [Bryobacteraceae bacterium]